MAFLDIEKLEIKFCFCVVIILDDNNHLPEKRSRSVQHRSEFNRTGPMRSQPQTYSFHSSTVTYGGTNGAYYTASTTRRMGGDGVMYWI